MFRTAMTELVNWKDQYNRKPLIIRGARQTGKTWLVRRFAAEHFENIIEINFDKDPQKSGLITTDVKLSLRYLFVDSGQKIISGKTLLFLDEIQNAPQVLHALRYFYEELPDLHIIATGSLLDFILEDHQFSMPVGRISYYHLGPMSFEEFLLANQEEGLFELLKTVEISDVPEPLHQKLLQLTKLYWIIGGMPAAVRAYVETQDIELAQQEHESILQTYQDDFSKYQRNINPQLLRTIFQKIPRVLGQKIKYSQILKDQPSRKIAQNLHLLTMAKLIYPVKHSNGNGVPLGSEVNDKDFKLLFLDIGLLSTILGLHLHRITNLEELLLVNNGAMAEQFIGQHLLYRHGGRKIPELFYWRRDAKSASSELDYLIEHNGHVLPIEVKAGTSGSLKSLHVFVVSKNTSLGIRFNTNSGLREESRAYFMGKGSKEFSLLSLPLYQIGQLERFCGDFKFYFE